MLVRKVTNHSSTTNVIAATGSFQTWQTTDPFNMHKLVVESTYAAAAADQGREAQKLERKGCSRHIIVTTAHQFENMHASLSSPGGNARSVACNKAAIPSQYLVALDSCPVEA